MELTNESGPHPMRSIVSKWLAKVKVGKQVKNDRFQKFADESMRFYSANHDFMWSEEYAQGGGGFLSKGASVLPKFRFTYAKPFEMVALFGPALYQQNPVAQVTPLEMPHVPPELLGYDPNDPYVQQMLQADGMTAQFRQAMGSVAQKYLNWLLQEQDLKVAARKAIVEAIIKGMAILWIEPYESNGGGYRYPKASFVSVDDLIVDPDADYQEDIQWVARRVVQPVNLVERKFGLPDGKLKGSVQSLNSQATSSRSDDAKTRSGIKGRTHDLLEYWEIYSKNGFGNRLRKLEAGKDTYDWSALGDYCYLAVAHGVPYPLNIPPDALQMGGEEVFRRASWPIPFYVDEGCDTGWPFTRLAFYEKPRDVWPEGIFKACIGELRFVNWCMSFLADKVAASCHTYVAIQKQAGVEIQDQLKSGMAPYTVMEISELTGKNINEVVSFLQAPNFPIDIWKMVSEVMAMIDKRTGLTELLYGLTNRQIRSATEADIRDQNLNVRPDDMASRVEDWLSSTCMKLAEAGLWMSTPEDVMPVLGQLGTQVWQQMQAAGIDQVVRGYDFRIEAGSAKKPNKGNKISQLHEFGQFALPVMQALALQGQVNPWNAYVSKWAELMEYDPSPFLIEPPAPPPEQGADQMMQDQEAQLKLQTAAQQMQMDQAKFQQEYANDQKKFEQDMKQAREEHKLKLRSGKKQ